MAKVTITIKDTDDDSLSVVLMFDPPLDKTEDGEESLAQYAGALAYDAITSAGESYEVVEVS